MSLICRFSLVADTSTAKLIPLRHTVGAPIVRLMMAFASIIVAGSSFAFAAAEEWRSLGPEGGPINRIGIDRHNTNTIYATNFGVFKTTDGGSNWKAANSGLISIPSGQVTAFAQDPQNSSTLYLG